MMASEAAARPMMSQEQVMVSAAMPKEPVQRNYVFVDEHNRHKRLKVMRACEGCRRRKIKCDSATTNTWPCAACTRLKLTCIPPTLNDTSDNQMAAVDSTFELQKSRSFPTSAPSNMGEYSPHAMQHQFSVLETTMQPTMPNIYGDVPEYQAGDYLDSPTHPGLAQFPSLPPTSLTIDPPKDHLLYSPHHIPQSAISERSWMSETNATHLADAFGDLKIGINAQAAYIADRTKLANSPAVQDYDVELPASAAFDKIVRIPPEMMPTEPEALEYFDTYFNQIHPFTPVLCKSEFLREWHYQRSSISPLLLEAIFACAAAVQSKEVECKKWLALAARHEESYKDMPRLSTVQALLLLLKAREAYPKRGYFYRSWNSLVNIIAMSKDLELDMHLEEHENGNTCNSTPIDCVCKTRIWQLLYILEAMIGGPQGRLNYSVHRETVSIALPQAIPGVDLNEYHISRQYVYFTRLIANIRETIHVYKTTYKMGDQYAIQPKYLELDALYPRWMEELPPDLQIEIPATPNERWIRGPFLGNVHCYHYLSFIMHNRPTVHHIMNNLRTESWKPYMIRSLSAAKKICRIQESMLYSLGMSSSISMLRGISFAIYCLLTCAMLQLVALTSPDPDINNDARDYFVRCMRLLERCTAAWKMDTIIEQINGLREAFSADVNKPFELKSGFPFGSPQSQSADLPLMTQMSFSHPQDSPFGSSTSQVSFTLASPVTPPKSANDEDSNHADSPLHQTVGMLAPGHSGSTNAPVAMLQAQWNPSRLWDKWSTAFTIPSAPSAPSTEQCSPTLSNVGSSNDFDVPQHDLPPTPYSPAGGGGYSPDGGKYPAPQPQQPAPTSHPTYNYGVVSPSAWQDALVSSYGPKVKRRLDYSDPSVQMGNRLG